MSHVEESAAEISMHRSSKWPWWRFKETILKAAHIFEEAAGFKDISHPFQMYPSSKKSQVKVEGNNTYGAGGILSQGSS